MQCLSPRNKASTGRLLLLPQSRLAGRRSNIVQLICNWLSSPFSGGGPRTVKTSRKILLQCPCNFLQQAKFPDRRVPYSWGFFCILPLTKEEKFIRLSILIATQYQ